MNRAGVELTVTTSERSRVAFLLRRSNWDDSRSFQFTTDTEKLLTTCFCVCSSAVLLSDSSVRSAVRLKPSKPVYIQIFTWLTVSPVWPDSPVEADSSVTRSVVVGGEMVTGTEEENPHWIWSDVRLRFRTFGIFAVKCCSSHLWQLSGSWSLSCRWTGRWCPPCSSTARCPSTSHPGCPGPSVHPGCPPSAGTGPPPEARSRVSDFTCTVLFWHWGVFCFHHWSLCRNVLEDLETGSAEEL